MASERGIRRRQFAQVAAGVVGGFGGDWSVLAADKPSVRTVVAGVPTLPDRPSPFDPQVPTALTSAVFDPGIVVPPRGGDPTPWVFSRWWQETEADEKQLSFVPRDGLTWPDGRPLTVEDVAFTVEYAADHPQGVFARHALDSVKEVIRRESLVEVELLEPVGAWRSTLATLPILPKHVWEGIDDPVENPPPPARALFGTGPFRLETYSRSKVALSARDGGTPASIGSDGPARLVVRAHDALVGRGGRIESDAAAGLASTLGDGSLSVVSAPEASWDAAAVESLRSTDGVDVTSMPNGWVRRVSCNLRRTPLDDVAFRQFLRRTWSHDRHRRHRVGVRRGDLVVPPDVTDLRPFGLDSPESRRFSFLGSDGDIDVAAAREYLETHDDRRHDYAFRNSTSDSASPDGKLLYVDSHPFGSSHTNNTDVPGQGPLDLIVANTAPNGVVRSLREWVETLQSLGIPVELLRFSPASWLDRVLRKQEFDLADASLWRVDADLHDIDRFYGEAGTNADGLSLNPMGYTGAASHVRDVATLMDPADRETAAHRALRRIYVDCPVVVYEYPLAVSATAAQWSGWTQSRDGVVNDRSWPSLVAAADRAVDTGTRASGDDTAAGGSADGSSGGSGGEIRTPGVDGTLLGTGVLGLSVTYALWRVVRSVRGSSDEVSSPTVAPGGVSPDATEAEDDSDGANDGSSPSASAAPRSDTSETATGETVSPVDEAGVMEGVDEASDSDVPVADTPESSSDTSPFSLDEHLRTDGVVERHLGQLPPSTATRDAVRIDVLAESAVETAGDAFERARRAWTSVATHDNVVGVLDGGRTPRPWIAFEADGQTLADCDGLSVTDAVSVVADACKAIRHASLYDTRHLALSPATIRLSPERPGNVDRSGEVLEWGYRPLYGASATPYDAPEQVGDTDGGDSVGRHTDVYRLGAVAYEALCGRPPLDGDATNLAAAIEAGEIAPVSSHDSALAPFDDVVAKALATDPADRYQSAHHLRMDLLSARE